MPNLCRAMASDGVRGRFGVAEVVGSVESGSLAGAVRAACLAAGKEARVEEVALPDLPGLEEEAKRKEVLADNGRWFACGVKTFSPFLFRC